MYFSETEALGEAAVEVPCARPALERRAQEP